VNYKNNLKFKIEKLLKSASIVLTKIFNFEFLILNKILILNFETFLISVIQNLFKIQNSKFKIHLI